MITLRVAILVVACGWLSWSAPQAATTIATPELFVAQHFPAGAPEQRAVWLTGELARDIETILGHAPNRLRLRYWLAGERSAWILEEIGKELPITAGFVVEGGVLRSAQVLVYRESRGGEVQYHNFLKQFRGADRTALGTSIDNISGATLSVRAMRRMAEVALRLHEHVQRAAS